MCCKWRIQMNELVTDLRPARMDYRVVVVDPPWRIKMAPVLSRYVGAKAKRRRWRNEWRANLPYDTMSNDEIAALPVGDWLADDAWCLVWVVTSQIEAAPGIVRGWGCDVRGWWCWRKTNGGVQLPGSWCRNFEMLLVGSKGRPRWTHTKRFQACFEAPRPRLEDINPELHREKATAALALGATHPPPFFVHSAKPSEFYAEVAERTLGPRLDVFARRRHLGWDGLGDELGCGT